MHSCFFRFGSPRRRQALHSGGGSGGVTVVSRGGEGVRAKIVVSRGELERIAAGVTRRQQGKYIITPMGTYPYVWTNRIDSRTPAMFDTCISLGCIKN